ncbi:Echinoderm microtubule-associated protein-like 4 [Sciurus carolinensis]|uniref:Echinoderm microtubule-associated protein-like 4 n=1 Tax=Sciurus carolinensis TaxID=30640 RepID=A0AA41ML03_SCICA|nr:Echinoderm microtubule-associated protein-like 4 [Sciurus carolinensis]
MLTYLSETKQACADDTGLTSWARSPLGAERGASFTEMPMVTSEACSSANTSKAVRVSSLGSEPAAGIDDSISAASTSDVQDRLSALELRVQQQEDEITVLKAALADVLRRLAISEDHVASVKKSVPSKGQPSLREAISMSCITNGSGANRKTSHTSSVSIARKETLSSAAKSIKRPPTAEKPHNSWENSDDSRNKLLRTASTSKLISKVIKNTDNLAIHPDKIRIATGQIAGVDKDGRPLQPHVRVWDSVSLSTLQIIGLGTFERGVGCLDFSKADSGIHLCVIDDSNEHMLTVWDWQKKSKGAEIKVPDQYGTIRAVAEGKADQFLVGTSRNFILRGTFNDGFQIEVQGHTDELWGLATHPFKDLLLTCAQDRQVCMWNSVEHKLEWTRLVDEPGHCADFHPSGTVVAIGTHSGRWFVLDAETRDLVSIHTDGNEQLSVMRYSVDGTLLAVGSHDNFIYLYVVSENGRKYSRYGKCTGHSSYITHLDWSPDNKHIMSNSGDYEILYWDIANGCKLIRNRSDCKDIDWTTYTCVLGFQVFGVWPEGSDGTDINALVRSHNRKVIAVADDFCKVHLFQYPCSKAKAPSHKYSAHSSHVTNVSFTHNDSHLISTGGKDMSIIQWKLVEKLSLPQNEMTTDTTITKASISCIENIIQSNNTPTLPPSQPLNETAEEESRISSSPTFLENSLEQTVEPSEDRSEEQSEGGSEDLGEPIYEEPTIEDTFFYSLVYDPSVKTLLADKGEIRVGPRYQADIPEMLLEGESDEREQSKLEIKVWDPNSPLTDRQIDQFLVVARAVGTFARALDCSSSVRQPSLHMSAAAASRDITLFHAMDTLYRHSYDLSSAISVLVPLGGPVLCRDEMEEWSASEASLFEEALEKYGKDFNDIRQDFDPRVRSHLSRQAMQGMPVRNTGSPKSAVKTRQAFFLHTTYFTKFARQVCKNTLRLRQAARRPFVAINYAAIRAEYADRHAELSGSPLKSKSTRKPLACIIGYLEIHPAKKPNVIRSTPSLQTPSTKRMLTTPNHTSLSILGKRNYSHHNGLDGTLAQEPRGLF